LVFEAARPYEVVVVGNAGIDTSVYLDGPLDLRHETDYTENVDGVGQSGGYSARSFARLGHRTAFLGYIGDDPMGRYLVEEMVADGVDMDHVLIDPAGTNRSVNLMSRDGQRHSFFDGKSHMSVEPDIELWRPVLSGVRLIHFSIPNWARRLLPAARAAGAVISVDLQDVHDIADPYRSDFVAVADVLFLSSVHLCDPRGALDALHRPGRIVVCGMGARGCAVRSDDGYAEHGALSLPQPVLDSTGAGDALAAGTLSAHVLEGHSLDDAVHRGQLAARWCCSHRGSRSLIRSHELEALVNTTT
jgi:sugar/nucleoside kinase (ribokinase family)